MNSINQDFLPNGLRKRFLLDRVEIVKDDNHWYPQNYFRIREQTNRFSFFIAPKNYAFLYANKEAQSFLGTLYRGNKGIESGFTKSYSNPFPIYSFSVLQDKFNKKKLGFSKHLKYTIDRFL